MFYNHVDFIKIFIHMTKNLQTLIFFLKTENIQAYVITSYDEYLSEYTSSKRNRLKIITNFSGSNGIAIIFTQQKSLFFTDGRYLLQAQKELDKQYFEIHDLQFIKNFDWSKYITLEKQHFFINPLICNQQILSLFPKIKMEFLEKDIIEDMLGDKFNSSIEVFEYSEYYSGEDYLSKVSKIREFLRKSQFENILLTNPENISWLLNLRSWDLEFTPTLLSAMLISQTRSYVFLDKDLTISEQVKLARSSLEFISISKLNSFLLNLEYNCIYDKNSNCYISNILSTNPKNKAIDDPCTVWKLKKNDSEILHATNINKIDSVAVCEFLAFIQDENKNSTLHNYSEYNLIEKLNYFRSQNSQFIKNSFHPICGFRSNAAIIHYKASKENSDLISKSGLLLIDSGGQYLGGTTDLTRTVAVGVVSSRHKYFYTKILKGHLSINQLIFPKNKLNGSHIDSFARFHLWQDFLDYPHSTGHGVSNFLNVHESGLSISPTAKEILLDDNMILSNEPGLYIEGEFGIRIENLIMTKSTSDKNFLKFQNLTLVPYDKQLIDKKLLTEKEIEYINAYYEDVMKYIYPELSKRAQKWMKDQINFMN
ncbi:MAG: M24 family metallopeptidase [Rickettsia sp.]|nr:M24 family metallopeptidase [Rickettsia sp.]